MSVLDLGEDHLSSGNRVGNCLFGLAFGTMPRAVDKHLSFIEALGAPLDRLVLGQSDLLIGSDGKLSVFYAPFDSINTGAKVVLLGLTPGWQQMKISIDAYRTARSEGSSVDRAQSAAKHSASFAGMRKRITMWLDALGLQDRLGMASTGQLFEDRSLLHTTSLIRYPAFVGVQHANYGGHSPIPKASSLLRHFVAEYLVPELASLPDALIVPMGTSVSRSLEDLKVTNLARCLVGFPHPSGANGHAEKQFQTNRSAMSDIVSGWEF